MNRSITFLYDADVESLPVYFLNCGREHVSAHTYSWNGLTRGGGTPYVIWQYTLAGCGAIEFGGREYLLTAGDSFLVTVPDDHTYYLPETSESWDFVYLTIGGDAVLRVVKEIQERFSAKIFHLENSAAAGRVSALIEQYRDQALPGRFLSSAMAYDLIMQLTAEIYARQGEKSTLMLADKVIAFLQKNTGRSSCDVESAAASLGFSRTHFTRLFKEETGVSPAKFILNWRLMLAARILSGEKCRVKEAAWRAGFVDVSHFCRVFRRQYGVSPEIFRKGGI